MLERSQTPRTVAVLSWRLGDGIREMLCRELAGLNCTPVTFVYGSPIPEHAEVLLTFGPYGPLLPVWKQAASLPPERRPVTVHWNTEGMPDLRLPLPAMRLLSWAGSQLGRMALAPLQPQAQSCWWQQWLGPSIASRLARFRYTGDYEYAFRRGWLHVLADTSAVYARLRGQSGIPTLYAPWGASSGWHSDLGLARDIDVLWMGIRGTARRIRYLNRVRAELQPYKVRMHVADNVEHPFIFNAQRTQYLNRAKICLNLTRTWYDDNFSRFALAASNRSLIISEPVLPHCPEFEAGRHYVSAPIDRLAETIQYYLQHDNERLQIVEQAYQLVTTKLDFQPILGRMLAAAISRLTDGSVSRVSVGPQPQGQRAPGTGDIFKSG
jgi:hypothetical protein